MSFFKSLALTAAITLASGSVFAADTAFQAAFGNTVKIKSASGEVSYFFEADGTYASSAGASGLWRINGDKVCLQPTGGAEVCDLNASDADVGASWDQAYGGGQATVSIVAGR